MLCVVLIVWTCFPFKELKSICVWKVRKSLKNENRDERRFNVLNGIDVSVEQLLSDFRTKTCVKIMASSGKPKLDCVSRFH